MCAMPSDVISSASCNAALGPVSTRLDESLTSPWDPSLPSSPVESRRQWNGSCASAWSAWVYMYTSGGTPGGGDRTNAIISSNSRSRPIVCTSAVAHCGVNATPLASMSARNSRSAALARASSGEAA